MKFLILMVFAAGLTFKIAGQRRLLLPAGLSQPCLFEYFPNQNFRRGAKSVILNSFQV